MAQVRGRVLKAFRLKHRIKQLELAKAAGLPASVLSRIEHEWDLLSPVRLNQILLGFTKLGISPSSLRN